MSLISAFLRELSHVRPPRVAYPSQLWERLDFGHDDNVSITEKGFEVKVDVKKFQPKEITVKTIDDCISIEGKHESTDDKKGYIANHFWKQYLLPKGYDPKLVSANLEDGVLVVKAPPPEGKMLEERERVVEIKPAEANVDATKPAEAKVDETMK